MTSTSGGEKEPYFSLTGEISYRCFTGCQKYLSRVKSPYEFSPVGLHLAYSPPPDMRTAFENAFTEAVVVKGKIDSKVEALVNQNVAAEVRAG